MRIAQKSTIIVTVLIWCTSAALAQSGGAKARATPRIIEGHNVEQGYAPWAASLQRADGGHFCGGSYISPVLSNTNPKMVTGWSPSDTAPEWLVTAAHCVVEDDGKISDVNNLSVLGGFPKFTNSSKAERQKIEKIIVHKLYNADTMDNDIAILKLEKPTKKMQAVDRATIRLPTIPDAVWLTQPYVSLYTAGWGRMSDSFMSDSLMEVQLPEVDHETCRLKLAAIGEIVPVGTMCAGFVSGEYDSCQGDSGGGLFYRPAKKGSPRSMEPILTGLVSWGIGCGSADVFGVYTNIWYYRSWMEQAVSAYYSGK